MENEMKITFAWRKETFLILISTFILQSEQLRKIFHQNNGDEIRIFEKEKRKRKRRREKTK